MYVLCFLLNDNSCLQSYSFTKDNLIGRIENMQCENVVFIHLVFYKQYVPLAREGFSETCWEMALEDWGQQRKSTCSPNEPWKQQHNRHLSPGTEGMSPGTEVMVPFQYPVKQHLCQCSCICKWSRSMSGVLLTFSKQIIEMLKMFCGKHFKKVLCWLLECENIFTLSTCT